MSQRNSTARPVRHVAQSGGILLKGVQTHADRSRPTAKRQRQQFARDRSRGFTD